MDAVRWLKLNRLVIIVADSDAGREGVFLPLFGIPASITPRTDGAGRGQDVRIEPSSRDVSRQMLEVMVRIERAQLVRVIAENARKLCWRGAVGQGVYVPSRFLRPFPGLSCSCDADLVAVEG